MLTGCGLPRSRLLGPSPGGDGGGCHFSLRRLSLSTKNRPPVRGLCQSGGHSQQGSGIAAVAYVAVTSAQDQGSLMQRERGRKAALMSGCPGPAALVAWAGQTRASVWASPMAGLGSPCWEGRPQPSPSVSLIPVSRVLGLSLLRHGWGLSAGTLGAWCPGDWLWGGSLLSACSWRMAGWPSLGWPSARPLRATLPGSLHLGHCGLGPDTAARVTGNGCHLLVSRATQEHFCALLVDEVRGEGTE